MLNNFSASPALKIAESFIDNVVRDRISEPAVGSVVYCALAMGYLDHSGIYIGENQIVHLDGSGEIEIVTPEAFLNRLGGLNLAISITVSCSSGKAVGSEEVAKRAKRQVGRKIQYRLLTNNCHAFTAGCLSGNFDNWSVTMGALKSAAQLHLGAKEWRVWDQSKTPPMAQPYAKKMKPVPSAITVLVPAAEWPFPTSGRP